MLESYTIIALIWGFGPSCSQKHEEQKIFSVIRKEIESLQLINSNIDWDKTSLYDFCVDFDKAKLTANNSFACYSEKLLSDSHYRLIVPTPDFHRCFYLVDMLLPQTECISLIGGSCSGKSTLAQLISQKASENAAIGRITSCQLADGMVIKRYIDTFYVIKKKNVATPLSWKPIAFIIEDVHMCYPSSIYLFKR